MQEQRPSAVGADAVQEGVTSDAEFYDHFSLDVHGIGQRHDVRTCADKSCGHPEHGLSTAGAELLGNKRAGEVHDGEGKPDPEQRITSYDPEIAKGGTDAIDAIDHDPDECPAPYLYAGGPIPRGRVLIDGYLRCIRCNRIDASTTQPEYTVAKGGGSKSGGSKERPQNAVVCPECHLEFCTCGGGEGVKSRRGRRKRIDIDGVHGRSQLVAFRVSEPAKNALQKKENAELINDLGLALMNGLTLEDARARLGLTKQSEAA